MAGFGETLYQARANTGATLKEAEQATRISRHHLAALEEENFSALPPLIYQRGIVRNYANYLRLDPGKLLVMFEEAHADGAGSPGVGLDQRPPVNMPGHWTPNFAVISFAVVLSAIVFAWVYSAFVAQPETVSVPTEAVPTATPFENDIPVPTKAPTQIPPTPEPTMEPTAALTTDPQTSRQGEIEQRGGDNVRNGATTEQATQDPAQSQRSGDNVLAATEEPEETPTLVPTSALDEADLTSISISATADIWVTVWADDEVVFDGNLATGQSTGHLIGNTFRVYSSIGGQTLFTNACGEEYLMGYETAEANYTLTRTADSCAPVRE
jgi:cytoskeletal protein RodZ